MAAKKTSSSALAPGAPAPDFDLVGDDGQRHTLASLRGKNVVLYFYPKDATPGCTTEALAFRDARAALEAKNAVVLGVSKDSVESHKKFKAKQELDFTLLSDPTGSTIEAYGAWGEKNMYGKKMMGIIRSTVLIDAKGHVKKVFPKVKVAGHVDEVLASL
jgi:thioredoxin-dependent peroxiredoxin